MNTILILDDDKAQLNYLSNLLKNDFLISTASDSIGARALIKDILFDAIIVDVHMPIINGFEFIKLIRQNGHSNSALFILSSDTSSETKLQALGLGVKDFLWPEMQKEEIILRIRNHISIIDNNKQELTLNHKDIKVDIQKLSAFISDTKLDLTLIEFKMLCFLISNATKVCKREEMKKHIWPELVVLDKTVNTHLTNLRSKISNSEIEIRSVKGEGVLLN